MDGLHFDDVIVGGGSAGCVLANRLSADGSRRVLLIEAGMDTPPEATPPEILDSYPMTLFFGDKYIWPGLSAAAGRNAEGKPVVRAYEQGRVMGGGSSINVQSANRGLPRDYDEWRDLGARGWGWADVLPYFLKLETDLDFHGPLHGKHGPIPIRRIAREAMPPFGHAVGEALSATGLPFRKDQNGEFEDGIFPPAFSNRNDRRVSTAAGYLDAATRARPNLTIWADSEVEQLQLDGRRATGVVVARGGQKLAVAAGRVILTAGALQSPAILMRAGIGPGAALQALGIPVAIDLPGVGSNLRDHPALTFCQYLPRAVAVAACPAASQFRGDALLVRTSRLRRLRHVHHGLGARRVACAGHAAWSLLSLVQPAVFERLAHAGEQRPENLSCCRFQPAVRPTRSRTDGRGRPAAREACRSSRAQPGGGRFLPGLLFSAYQAAEPVRHRQSHRCVHPRANARHTRGPQGAS